MLTIRVAFMTTMITLFTQIDSASSAHLFAISGHQNVSKRIPRVQPRRVVRARSDDELEASQTHLRTRDLRPVGTMNSRQNHSEPTRSGTTTRQSANNQASLKRFKSSFRGSAVSNDLNNNTPSPTNSTNVASNEIQVDGDEIINQPRNWRTNVSSINGTIDVTEYQQNDLDRLYGDALLVYFKNFNE